LLLAWTLLNGHSAIDLRQRELWISDIEGDREDFYSVIHSGESDMAVAIRTGAGLLKSSSLNGQWADWQEVVNRFLEAIEPQQRDVVSIALADPYGGGWGLRLWVSAIIWGSALMPAKVPTNLIEVYLTDPEVIPLHDCCSCGLAVPVRPNKLQGSAGEPEKVYFPLCPSCNSPTGWYLCRSF